MVEISILKNNFTNIQSAQLLIVDNNRVKILPMKYSETAWNISLNLPDGEYLYKFILNNGIRMNDPNAYEFRECDNGEILSVLKISDGKVVRSNYKQSEISKFCIYTGSSPGSHKTIMYPRDRKCYARFELNNVIGTHSITVLWYQPDGSLYHIEETALIAVSRGHSSYSETLWVNLEKTTHNFEYGTWMTEIYIDGIKQIREYFNVINSHLIKSMEIMNLSV